MKLWYIHASIYKHEKTSNHYIQVDTSLKAGGTYIKSKGQLFSRKNSIYSSDTKPIEWAHLVVADMSATGFSIRVTSLHLDFLCCEPEQYTAAFFRRRSDSFIRTICFTTTILLE